MQQGLPKAFCSFTGLLLLLQVLLSQAAIRYYDFTIHYQFGAPDGVEKTYTAINGQMPGPALEAVEGDTIVVNVHNNISEATSVHFHGIEMKGSYFMDGTAWVTQCPIPPGSSFRYNFTVNQWGTYWYHSHMGTQRGEGLFGPIIITPKGGDPYQGLYQQEYLLLLTDWYWDTSIVFLHRNGVPGWQSGLINGKGRVNCSRPDLGSHICHPNATRESFRVESGQTYRFRIFGSHSLITSLAVSFDGHPITVIGADGLLTKASAPVDSIAVATGETYDVLLHANQPTGRYWVRAAFYMDPPSNLEWNRALATLDYEGADLSEEPTSLPKMENYTRLDDLHLEPLVPSPPPPPERYENFTFTLIEPTYYVNDLPFEFPSIPLAFGGYYEEGSNRTRRRPIDMPGFEVPLGTVVQLVMNNQAGRYFHPMHLHGSFFYLLGTGKGTFNSSQHSAMLNEDNPLVRHTVSIPANGWAVVRFHANNPGWWLMHCHVDFHAETGFAITIYVRDPEQDPIPPPDIPKPCLAGTPKPSSSDISGWERLPLYARYLIVAGCCAVVILCVACLVVCRLRARALQKANRQRLESDRSPLYYRARGSVTDSPAHIQEY